MKEMTSRERFLRMFDHREADRIPIIDSPWGATIERWQREGMPKEVSYVDYFGLDHVAGISVDNSPRYEERVIEETEEYKITTTRWGATLGKSQRTDRAGQEPDKLGAPQKAVSHLAGEGNLDTGGLVVRLRHYPFMDGGHRAAAVCAD